ncbi:MAG: hypothetical protein A2V98_12565 [Planctomycetes bacterium RBG_16_64_12]|nr:MAG: hypothetical protein A2V98_12565 [Planctomycetes bacterium RBG_16_64_12]
MLSRLFFAVVVSSLLFPGHCIRAESSGEAGQPSGKDTFWFVPHTHWEGAVFKTREEYLEMGLPHILSALRLLEARPDYRFVLDQVCYVRPFLERYPEEEATFRKMVAEGRLEIVGGTDVMADVNMPGGESFVRQVLYGKGYYRRKLGLDMTVSWQLDTFGHHAQMPQILKLAGYKSFWFFRGVSSWEVPSEFLWQGLDGSKISAFWLPHGYAVTYASPRALPEFSQFFKDRFQLLTPFSRGTDRVGLAGADVCEPEEHVPALVEAFNQQADAPFVLRIGLPSDFEAVAARRADRPVIGGELNPIFQGAYSSRIELKQWMRSLEALLLTGEKLGAISNWLGVPTDDESVWRAWEPVLFNEAHDLASGVMTDHVYDDTVGSYRFAERLGNELVESRLETLVSRIDTQGEGIPLVVFNTLGWSRTDAAEVKVGFSQQGVQGLRLLDSAGEAVPVQLSEAQRYGDGGLRVAQIVFLARDVPAMGYATYRIVPLVSPEKSSMNVGHEVEDGSLENEFFRLAFDRPTGAMTSLVVKSPDWEVLRGPANVVTCQHDAGDLWELYRPLDGGSRIAMKDRQPVPLPDTTKFSNQFTGESGQLIAGPVFSQYQVSHPFGETGKFSTRVRLYAGLRRIEVRTQIVNQEKHVRYQALFPTTIEGGRSVHEIPFAHVERPEGIEFPAQNWVDYGNDERGLTLLNRGLPGNVVTDATMMLSLVRATRIVAYGFGGGYEPGMTSDSGYELGRPLSLEYALVPRVGPWREAGPWRQGLEFNHPLLVRKAACHEGMLPDRAGLLEMSHPNVVLSTLKPGPQGSTILRVYEAAGQPAPAVTIKLRPKLSAACEANLMEDPGRKLEVADNALRFDLGPFEIKTFRLQLAAGEAVPE